MNIVKINSETFQKDLLECFETLSLRLGLLLTSTSLFNKNPVHQTKNYEKIYFTPILFHFHYSLIS